MDSVNSYTFMWALGIEFRSPGLPTSTFNQIFSKILKVLPLNFFSKKSLRAISPDN